MRDQVPGEEDRGNSAVQHYIARVYQYVPQAYQSSSAMLHC
jgi:hypothetical protein